MTARMVSGVCRSEHITPVLEDLHWLPISQRVVFTVIPLHWQIFIGHRPKKYRTSHKNIGFIGHMYVSVLNLYTSAMPDI